MGEQDILLPSNPSANLKPAPKKKAAAVSNVAKLDAEHPIPFEKKGIYTFSSNGTPFIPFIGEDDSFFETLTEVRFLSPTTNACVNTKVKYTVGAGWTFKDDAENNRFNEFAKRVNNKGESLNAIIGSVAENLYTSGNAFINLVFANVGNTSKIRIFVKNNFESRLRQTDKDWATHAIFDRKFRNYDSYQINRDTAVVPLYDGNPKQKWWKDKEGNEHLCIHVKVPAVGNDYYGLPSNIAGLIQAMLEYKGARYNIDNFENNLVIGGIVAVKSNMSSEEAAKHSKNLVKTYSGDGKRGRHLFLSAEDGIEDLDIKNFETTKDGSFVDLDTHVSSKIVTANSWHPILAGIESGGSLGRGKGYFREVFETMYNSTIRPEQDRIIEHFLNPLFEIMKYKIGEDFTKMPIDIVTPMPVSYGSEIDPNKVLTINEGRKFFQGLEDNAISEEVGKQIIDQYKPTTTNVPGK